MNGKNFTWFITASMVLLFISGCWTLGSLIMVSRQLETQLLRSALLTADMLANISFLVSLLTSVLGLAELLKEMVARRITGYAFTAGTIFLIISITIFIWTVTSQLPTQPLID